jgi:hypothetical protein
MGTTTALLPTDVAVSMGSIFRGALRGRPKLIVLLGVWMLFFPGFIGNFVVLILAITAGVRGLTGFALLMLSIGCWSVCSIMLYRVTRNYLTLTRCETDEQIL